MELVGLTRLLWKRKLAVVAGAIASVALGLFSVTAASTHSGVASLGVVLDTPRSQLIAAKPLGADTLAWRAALLGDVMGSDSMRSALARELRVPVDKIAVTAPQLQIPSIATPLPERALEAAAATTEPYVLSIGAPLPLPILEVDASAPSRAEAERLAKAALSVMQADAPGATPDTEIQPYVVESAGPVHSAAIVDGPRKLVGGVIAIFLFALWCAVLAIVPAVRRLRAGMASAATRHTLAALALSGVVAAFAAALNSGAIGLLPPRLGSPDVEVAAAAAQVFVDTPEPSVVHRDDYPPTALIKRAELMGRVLTSATVLERIGRRAGIPPDQISAGARMTQSVPVVLTEPSSEERASQVAAERRPYRIEVQARQATPVLDVYARAPSPAEAERLADAAVAGLDDHLHATAVRESVARGVRLRQLGPARVGVVNSGMPLAIAILTFVATFAVVAATLLTLQRRLRAPAAPRPASGPTSDDWPRTTRLLPWSFAAFLALLWLVPFNDIELTVSTPIDLKLDRLLLPFVLAAWGLTLVVGSRGAVRFRITWIHAGVAAFVLCAFLSVVLEARSLNRALELEGSVKQLPLLISYVSLFLIAATAIRPTEVRPFMTYTLVLAVICAVGVIWEYRMEQNLFFEWSDKLLPGVFELPEFDASHIDNIGRRLVRGPAALPLEAVAMLAMALPIALVWLMQSRRWRDRVLYGLAVCLLLAATLATFRKSALLAPIAVVLTIAYFRRSELLKLAPLALVLVVVVHIVAPGAIGRTGTQFDSLGVSTVSDRSADYDAVRPDLWSHLVFGRGWGSYSHEAYRILDSEILHRVLEMGVIGLLAYAFMILSVVIFSSSTIASRDPRRAPLALAGAAAAMSFLVVSTLFDVLAFPHATYIFLYMAGLVAVVLQWETERPQPVASRHEARVHAQNGAVRTPHRRGAGAVS